MTRSTCGEKCVFKSSKTFFIIQHDNVRNDGYATTAAITATNRNTNSINTIKKN